MARTHLPIGGSPTAVIDLAAGLDTLRMSLSSSLPWIEVDHADSSWQRRRSAMWERAGGHVERGHELSVGNERRAVLAEVGSRFRRLLVMAEGLLCYLTLEDAMGLARNLRSTPSAFRWIAEIHNAAVDAYIAGRTGHALPPWSGVCVWEPRHATKLGSKTP